MIFFMFSRGPDESGEPEEFELVDHTPLIDVESENEDFLLRSEEMWYEMEATLWWQPPLKQDQEA